MPVVLDRDSDVGRQRGEQDAERVALSVLHFGLGACSQLGSGLLDAVDWYRYIYALSVPIEGIGYELDQAFPDRRVHIDAERFEHPALHAQWKIFGQSSRWRRIRCCCHANGYATIRQSNEAIHLLGSGRFMLPAFGNQGIGRDLRQRPP